MVAYQAKLREYFSKREAIGTTFCAVAANAEKVCATASKSAHTNEALDAAHNILKAQFRMANQTRADALEKLGPRPVESN